MKYIINDEYTCEPAVDICFNSLYDAEEYMLAITQEYAYDEFVKTINLTDITIEQYFNCMEEELAYDRFVTFWGNLYEYYTHDYHIYALKEV